MMLPGDLVDIAVSFNDRRDDDGRTASLTAEDLADASGVRPSEVDRFVEAGVLAPDETGAFEPWDIAKVRLVVGLTEAGLGLEDLAAAIRQGRLSFDYVRHLMPEPVRLVAVPHGEEQEAVAGYEEWVRPIVGGSRVDQGEIREDDLALGQLFTRAVALGAPPERIARIVRSVAQSTQHLVDLQREFIDEQVLGPAIAESGSPLAALESTAALRFEFRQLGRRLVAMLMERFVDEAVFKNLVQLTELALAAGGVTPPDEGQAMVFLDVSAYTRRSQESGDEAAARQALLLADLVQELAAPGGGRMVKSLGDGAMVHFPEPSEAVRFALAAVAAAPGRGMWPLHAGVNSGPMLRRDGDYFGTAVNVASRVADEAGEGRVLVTRSVVDGWRGGDGVRFVRVGEVELKNVAEPVELYAASSA